MILNYQDQSNNVWSMTKTRQDNDVVDHIGPFYAKNKIEQLWSIWRGTIDEEEHIKQQRD